LREYSFTESLPVVWFEMNGDRRKLFAITIQRKSDKLIEIEDGVRHAYIPLRPRLNGAGEWTDNLNTFVFGHLRIR